MVADLLKYPLTSGDAARALGLSNTGLRLKDDELEFIVLENKQRRYSVESVAALRAARAKGNR